MRGASTRHPTKAVTPAKAVIPAKAGIHWRDVLRDSCRSLPLQAVGRGRNDGKVEILHLSTPSCPGMTAYVALSARRVMNFGLMT